MMDGINRLEYAPRTPQAAGARLFWACRNAGFFSRATATAAGPNRRPATSNTCFMVVLEKIWREVEAPYAQVATAVSACDNNLVGRPSTARSGAGEALDDEVSGGDFDLHETPSFIQPEIDRTLTLRAHDDVPQAGGVSVEGRGRHSQVVDLDDIAPQAPRENGCQRARLGRATPCREDVKCKHRIVEHRRSLPGREFPGALGGARDEPHGEPSPAQLAENARGLTRIGDVVLQRGGHRVAVHFEDGRENHHRPRAIVADRRSQRPTGIAARQSPVRQTERLARDLECIDAHDEDALVHGRSCGLKQRKGEETCAHAATAPKTRVAMRS